MPESKVALAVFCISITAFTGQSLRWFSWIIPVHLMFFLVIWLDILENLLIPFLFLFYFLAILLLISEVRVTPLSLVLCHCGSLFRRWCSTCSRKLSFFLSQQCFGCRRNGRLCLQYVWSPSETSFLLLLASVVTVADTAGAVEGILWRENGNGLCNYMGHVWNRETETDGERRTERIFTEGEVKHK